MAWACSWRRPTRPAWPASPAPRARAPRPRLAVHLLTGLGYRARAGGNIGQPPWDPSPEPEPDYWIVETSSFQVPDLCHAPRVVAVTSLSPDHLDWHGTVERYYADKLSLCTKPGVALALADGSDDLLRAQAAQLGPHLRWVTATEVGRDAGWSRSLGLPGPHNARNASIARAVLVGLGIAGASDEDRLAEAAQGFAGAAQPLPFAGHGRRGRVRRRQPLDERAAGAGGAARLRRTRPSPCWSAGTTVGWTTRRSARAVAARTAPTLVVTMPDNGPRIGAAVRDGHRRPGGGDRRGEPRRGSRHRVRVGRRRGAWCCSRRPPRASGASATTASVPAPSPRRPPAAGSSAERSQRAPAGASSSRSLRNSHHESAETMAAASTTSGSAPSSREGLHRPTGVLDLLGAVDVPEAGALLVEPVVTAQPVGLRARDVRRLDLVGGDHGQGGRGVVRRRGAHDREQRRRRRGRPRLGGGAGRLARKDSKSSTWGSGDPSSSARFASTSSRARPSGRACAMVDRVSGSSRSMCRYCSAYAASSASERVPASQRR